MNCILFIICLLLFGSVSCFADQYDTQLHKINVTEFAIGLKQPWGAAFLPDGRLVVTEKSGGIRIVDRLGKVSKPIAGGPDVYYAGQGGLLDIAVDPAFATNGMVYLSYSEADERGTAGTAVGSGRLTETALEGFKVIWRQIPKVSGSAHFGSRLIFAPDGTLFITTGDRYNYRDKAQDLSTHIGKVIRITSSGEAPKDNPFYGSPTAKEDIWSYGHRNIQGAAIHPEAKELWTHEHGAQGGDEINLDRAGKNYGWPIITYGKDYSGAKIGEGTAKDGMEQPLHYWDPSIAPSGMLFYTGNAFPKWQGNLFIGALKSMYLNRIIVSGTKIVREERLLEALRERIRDIEQDKEGNLYVLTDNYKGRILKISPAL